MPDTQIFKATYSGIPVYEMMCKGVAVMRRRADSWLNATQILKVAGFDKPQRTRVLEREVQKGEHEKVQGGYGKYQGTWIPLERGLNLAKQYNCETLLRPIIEFQPAAKSPPLAPKHLVATTTRPARRPPTAEAVSSVSMVNTRSSRRQPPGVIEEESDHETLSVRGSEDGSMTPSPSEASSSSRTPSPIHSPHPSYGSAAAGDDRVSVSSRSRRNKYHRTADDHYDDASDGERANGAGDARTYGDQILEYFISDTNQIPPVLINPPRDFDPNMAIDDDGHTPLHWACAMGRIRIVKLLLTAGADIFKVNKAGQTPLMRSVMFANNYDVRKFPELYELLHRSTLNIDNYNRTLFHHIVDIAMSKGKSHAARYYMETVLTRLADYPKELADVINFQDEDGETALTMAARCRSKRLVKILIDHGADPKIVNNDGKSTEDYILEDERFRSSPVPPSRALSMSFRNAQVAYPPPNAPPNYAFGPANGDRPPLHHSVAAQKASTRCVNDITSMLDSLAASFDQELRDKERDTTQAHAVLGNIQGEILESQRSVAQLRAQAEGLMQAKQSLKGLEEELYLKMGRRYRLGWEKWVKDEELREAAIREAANGELIVTAATASYRIEEDMEVDASSDPEKTQGKRKSTSQLEDISDLIALNADIPTDPAEVRRACEALRDELGQMRKRRKVTFEELVSFQAEAGTSGRMAEYRRLIGAGCGGVPPSEVDHVLGMLLETLESEEPSSSSTAWSGAKPTAGG
ncbi:Cell division cycle-related protein res2/pct1 [Hypsizygus marmoreus]|uniref:Cell division cycle-related protein res2/pct1 n=1 Tax=Hypsizygus marmoreus TaxID=39966 RepID=A0A369JE67_HYPMA|nr:Cell division cycle-related protein res2/pct1 [Hypsizygus marmoreus]